MNGISLTQLAVLALVGIVPATAQAQPVTVEEHLYDAEQVAIHITGEAARQGRSTAMAAAQSLLHTIINYRAAYPLSKRSLSEVPPQHAALIQAIDAAAEKILDFQLQPAKKLEETAEELSRSVERLPLPGAVPRVTEVKPLYAIDGSSSPAEIRIRGINLSNATPRFEIAGLRITPSKATDTELIFVVPAWRTFVDRPVLTQALLTLYARERSWWSPIAKYEASAYPITIPVYPRRVGVLTTTAVKRVTTPLYTCNSKGIAGGRTEPVSVSATRGWSIDPASIRYNSARSNHGSSEIKSPTETGFMAVLSCRGWLDKTGSVVKNRAEGFEAGTFSYVELQPFSVERAPVLSWGQEIQISNLPEGTELVRLRLTAFTGEELPLETDGRNRFLKAEFSATRRVLEIEVEDAKDVLE